MQTAISDTVAIPRAVLINLGVIGTSALAPIEKWDTAWYLLEEFCGTSQSNGSIGRAANEGAGTESRKGLTNDYVIGCIPETGISRADFTTMLAEHGFEKNVVARTLGRMEKNGKFLIRDSLFFRPHQTQQVDGSTAGSTTTQNQETRTPVPA